LKASLRSDFSKTLVNSLVYYHWLLQIVVW